jgi:hypothetical protein
VTGPSVGVDSQRGYFAAWVPKTGRLVLRRSNGRTSTELGSVAVPTPPTTDAVLVVEAVGTTLGVRLEHAPESRLAVQDHRYPRGSVGLRVVGSHAVFDSFSVEPIDTA